MPKPVKKAAAKPKKPSSDPNRRAHQLVNEHMAKLTEGKWQHKPSEEMRAPFTFPTDEDIIREHMRKLGAKGGKISGARRTKNLSKEQLVAIARKGGLARAKKAKKKSPSRS